MAGTAQQDPFYIVDIGAQKWPVILIPEDLLISEDKVALPIDDLIFPVLAVERNDIHWVTGSQLMPADTSDIFDLATIATELKNESLYHACQQVVEHDTTDYWILQFQSLRLAMQKQDEEYAALSRDQVSAETMARKRQRSPSSDPDDLYSSPSAAKKSREDDKASSTSSFASSETLKSSSQPLTSGSSINSRHSSTPLEKNQGLSGFMIESTKFKRRRDGLNDSEGQRDDTVKAREEWFPEHPGLEDRSSELGHSSVIWTTAQNAELIRLRERVKPTPSWQQTAEALHRKFAKECMFKRMRESQPRNHYERMIKEEARTSHGHVSKNGIWAREEALAFLNKQEVKKQSAPTDNGYHKYTTAEDLEIIRLREVDMVNCTWDQVTDVFNKKFSRTTRTRRLWQSVVYGRYQKLKPESEQQEDKSDDSNNEDEAEEAREDWMPEHHVLGKSSLALTSVSWTTKEDAELLHLREQTRPKPSWRETAEVLNQNFHTRGMNATPHNYNNTRERWRHMKGENNFSAEGKALRQKALALLADDESVLQNSIPNPFTKREDAELVKLREVEMPNKPWAQLAVVFNAKLHPRLGDQTRSESTLHSRYQLLYSKWDEVAEDQSISILEFAQSGQIKSGTKVWTSAQDDELVHLRNTMPGKSWWDVAKAFNAHGETKGWPARTTRTIEKRFNAELKRAEDNKQSDVVVIDDGDLVPQMPAVPKLFTADEDSKLIVLREKLSGLARWDQITKDFNRKFSQAPRSTGSLRSRYNDALQEGARRQIQGTVDQRARAIDTFRENGIEFQVNDSISDSASEREEDGDDEDDKEAEEGFRDGSGEDGKLEHEEPEDDGAKVTILIGERATPFTVPLSRVSTNRYFMDDQFQQLGGGHIIRGFRWTSIEAKAFQPLYEFLTRCDYNPPLDPIRKGLQGITTEDQHNTQLLRCAQIFVLARQLLLWDLAALVIRKVKLLRKGDCQILVAARLVFAEPPFEQDNDVEMRRLLVEEVVRRFWDLMEKGPGNMRSIMEHSPLFQVALFERMAKNGKKKYDAMFG